MSPINVLQDPAAVRALPVGHPPVCIVARPADLALIAAAGAALGFDAPRRAEHDRSASSRPVAEVDEGSVAAVLFTADEHGELITVSLRGAVAGALIVAGDGVPLEDVVTAVSTTGRADGALARVLVLLARLSEVRLEEMLEGIVETTPRKGSSSAWDDLLGLRAQALSLQHVYAIQRRLVGPDNELAAAWPDAADELRHAAEGFEYASGLAERLSAFVGDVLSGQNAAVMGRLTLVSTIFLPLTLATSFFGMNFAWMSDHIGSAAAFGAWGIVFPILITALTMVAVRRFSES